MKQTIYLGDTLRPIRGKRCSFERYPEREPEGEDMPVFDRAASGYRGEYERPDDWADRVTHRKVTRRQMHYNMRRD